MNAAYNEISCADAAKMIGMEYSSVAKWCKAGKINCVNVSGGTKSGRYVIKEDEVQYIKLLKQKFGKGYMKKYRKDWRIGQQPAEAEVKQPMQAQLIEEKPKSFVKSVVTNITTEESTRKKVDIDEIAIKFGCLQDLKDELESLDAKKAQVTAKIEELRKELMQYL